MRCCFFFFAMQWRGNEGLQNAALTLHSAVLILCVVRSSFSFIFSPKMYKRIERMFRLLLPFAYSVYQQSNTVVMLMKIKSRVEMYPACSRRRVDERHRLININYHRWQMSYCLVRSVMRLFVFTSFRRVLRCNPFNNFRASRLNKWSAQRRKSGMHQLFARQIPEGVRGPKSKLFAPSVI